MATGFGSRETTWKTEATSLLRWFNWKLWPLGRKGENSMGGYLGEEFGKLRGQKE